MTCGIRVTRHTYRGQTGFLVGWWRYAPRQGWRQSVFFEHETAARRFADRLRVDPDASEAIDFAV